MKRLYKRVVIESPFGGPTPEHQQENLRYLRACMRDCLDRGEAPFASHGLYTQPGVLDDWDPQEREKGILAGFEWRLVAQSTVVYADRGITPGMRAGIRKATDLQQHGTFDHYVEYRFLGGEWSALGGPEEIRKHLDHLLDGHEPKHRHLALVTGPAGSPRQVQMISTPAELSMASVAVVKKVESPTGPQGLQEADDLGPVRARRLCENCATLEHRHTYAQHVDGGRCLECECQQFCTFAKVPPLTAEEQDAIELNATVGAGVPSRSYTRDVAQEAAAQAQLDRISEATRFAQNRMIADAGRCPEWIRWKPNQGMSDGQCKLALGHLGDHDYDSRPTTKLEMAPLNSEGAVFTGRDPTLRTAFKPEPVRNFGGEFGEGESLGGHGAQTDDYGMEYQDAPDGQRPLTMEEVRDLVKKGGEERAEAEKTIKRPPRR